MSRGDGKKSLQDVLRARREAPSLLSPAEAAKREAARRQDELEAEAAAALERWRDGRSPDARGKLAPEAYSALFRLSPAAYEATGHWARRAKAQLALAPACEVERCGAETGVSRAPSDPREARRGGARPRPDHALRRLPPARAEARPRARARAAPGRARGLDPAASERPYLDSAARPTELAGSPRIGRTRSWTADVPRRGPPEVRSQRQSLDPGGGRWLAAQRVLRPGRSRPEESS